MAVTALRPPPKFQALDLNGNPLAGGKLYTYSAGTTSALATYTDSTGTVANANPVILDSRGEASVWFQPLNYKLVLKDADDNTIWTQDNYSGSPYPITDEWITYVHTWTFVDATHVTVPGDQTAIYTANKAIRAVCTGGTYYGTLTSSVYDGSTKTTLTVSFDAGSFDSGVSGSQTISIGVQSSESPAFTYTQQAVASASAAAVSETNAATSATAAASSASAASTSATNAATSATNAASSASTATTKASEASTSATNAASSASTATTKASEASTSATNAANSASSASTSASNASTSASAASTSASNASSSATSAASSASTATTKASEASTSATNAASSASTATTKASEASTSATNAATSASTATTKASEASTSATNAANSASSASTSATNASNSETAAASSASISSTSATNAANSATAAANSATSAANYAAAIQSTSTTSLAIGTGAKTFATQAGKQYAIGQWLTATSAANSANYMFGQVTSYSGTSLVVDVTVTGGSGTLADWNISISGVRGATGATGTASGIAVGATSTNPTASGTSATGVGHAASAGANRSFAGGANSGGNGSVTATGAGSTAFSGSYASGADSFAAAIANNTSSYGATGVSAIVAGNLNKASGSYAVSVGGYSNLSSGNYSVTYGGNTNTASGVNASVLGGKWNTASGDYSYASGYSAVASRYGKQAFASGRFSTDGDAQTGVMVLRGVTTDATPKALTSDAGAASATNQVALNNYQSMAFSVLIVARASSQDTGGYKLEGVIERTINAANTTIIGTPAKTTFGEDVAAWDVAAVADTTNGALSIQVTGAAASTIQWVATVWTTEVTY